MNEETQILKTDELGRVLTPREKREALLDAFERSGMTGAQFARHAGIKYPTLMNWIQRRRRDRVASGPENGSDPRPGWIEAVVESSSADGLTVELSAGLVVRIPGEGSVGVAVRLLHGLGYGRPC
jgi:transposase-like protein